MAASKILEDDAEDSIANMRLVDAVYLAAGLAPRLPSAKAVGVRVKQEGAASPLA